MKSAKFTFFIITIFAFFSPFASSGQFTVFRNFNVKDGLPSSEVHSLMQDSKGYMWFATDMGVSRYNGYEFRNFSTEHGMPDNTVFVLHEDKKQRVWFATISGTLGYFHNDSIYTVPANKQLSKMALGWITSMYVDERDTIWLGYDRKHLIKIAPGWKEKDIIKVYLCPREFYIYEFKNGASIYGGSGFGLVSLYRNHRLVCDVKTPIQGRDSLHPNSRASACKLKNGRYFFSIHEWAIVFDTLGNFQQLPLNTNAIVANEDAGGTILVGTFSGIQTLKNNQLSPIDSGLYKPFYNKAITGICFDKENELWVSTKGHGVLYAPYLNFNYFTAREGVSESGISCMGEFGDYVAVGHLSREVSVLKPEGVKAINFKTGKKIDGGEGEVTNILNLSKEKVGIFSMGGGIFLYSTVTNKFSSSQLNMSKKIIRRKNGKILLLQFRSLTEYDSLLTNYRNLEGSFVNTYSDNIYEDRNGLVWICTNKGLYTYDTINKLQYRGANQPELSARIVDLAEGAHNTFWMVSRGKGVIVQKGKQFFLIQKKNGLTSNMCRTLLVDTGNTVWVGTNDGLNKITVRSYEPFLYSIETYTSKNGLLTNEVNFLLKHGGKIWLAHNNGVSVFSPAAIKNNMFPPPIHITETRINNEKTNEKDLNHLKYSDNYLTINYNGISYKNPGEIEYKYKLEGLDTSWIYSTTTHIKYQTLPPGTYRFVVYAINNDGVESSHPATFSFKIFPPWWQTWTFRIAMALVLFVATGIVFKYRLNIIKRKERLKTIQRTRMASAELKALRAQMNPHFVFNAINSVQYFITKNDSVSSQKYLAKFAKLIRYVVDNSKPQVIPLKSELNALQLYLDLECLRFGEKITYNIVVDEKVDESVVEIPSMLIQPFVENAIWHGLMPKEGNGRIDIRVELQDDVLLCVVEDNGIGRKQSQQLKAGQQQLSHKSIGMSVTQERLEIINSLHNRNLSIKIFDREDDDGKSLGTRVELYIPLN